MAAHKKGDIAVGVNIGGAGLRYFLTDRLSFEALGQGGEDFLAGGARQYLTFNPKSRSLHFYFGLEEDYLRFDTDTSEGNGLAYGAFLGGEQFLKQRFSVQVDAGGMFIDLEDDTTAVTEDGFVFTVNIGIQWYFKRGQ